MSEGFGGGAGFGARPAVLVVDLLKGFTDTESPLGANLDVVLESTRALLDCARDAGVPVIFTTVVYDEASRLSMIMLPPARW